MEGCVAETIEGVAGALKRLAGRTRALQDLSWTPVEALTDASGALQSLDLVTQESEALANYLEDLAAACQASWCVDTRALAARVPLTELAGRLLGKDMAPASREPSGELQLF